MNEPIFWLVGYFMGIVAGYIIWAPETKFKQSFINGISFKFIWGRFIK